MPSPNEWDLIMGDNPQAQAQMLATMLRQRQAMGDLVGLVGGKSFSPWGTAQSKMAGDQLEALAQAAYHRRTLQQQAAQQAAQERYQMGSLAHGAEQLASSERQHGASLAQARDLAELNAKLEREKMANDLEKARIMAAARAGGGMKMLSPAERTKLAQIDKAIGIIDQSIKVVQQNPNAFGFGQSWGTLAPWGLGSATANAIQGRFVKTPQMVKAHSFVMAQPYEEFHKLAGSQQTPQEIVRTEFLPQATDDPQRITAKLLNMRSRLAAEQNSMMKVLHLAPGSLMIGSADQQGMISPNAPVTPEDSIPPMIRRPPDQDDNLGVHPLPAPRGQKRLSPEEERARRQTLDMMYERLLEGQ